MSKNSAKYYVVWTGRTAGIYLTWEECKSQVEGAKGARYKAFSTMEEAQKAYQEGAPEIVRHSIKQRAANTATYSSEIIQDAYAVDAACSGNPGKMEYRGVDVKSHIQLFHFGPIMGTNNIGEFLAIVHALALQKQQGTSYPIYSDSRNAILWVKAKKCKTKLTINDKTQRTHQLIERAERWLQSHDYSDITIMKWHTDRWGEIPADFGRK